jgi:hypothetical protein
MEMRKRIDKKTFLLAAFITLLIFISVYALNLFLNMEREETILKRMDEITEEFDEMRAISSLMQVFGENVTCLALKSELAYLDPKIWKLGNKIDAYREVTREYWNDPFYIKQKKRFNRQEIIYLSMLKEMKKKCKEMNQTIILFFYKKAEECKECDAQSFVLTNINRKIDPEIAIFSFDCSLNLSSVNVLVNFYNIVEFPCTVVEDKKYCGLHNREEIEKILCSHGNLSIC